MIYDPHLKAMLNVVFVSKLKNNFSGDKIKRNESK